VEVLAYACEITLETITVTRAIEMML